MACRVFIGLPEVSVMYIYTISFGLLFQGGILSGVYVSVVEMVHQEGRLVIVISPFLSHAPTFTGIGTTLSRFLRWPINIQRVW